MLGRARTPGGPPWRDWPHAFVGNTVSEYTSNISSGLKAEAKWADTAAVAADAVLLERCRRGELAAFGLLVRKYQDRVFNSILRMCANRDDAEELCQETFVKALQSLGSFRQESGFYTWLFRIAVNLTISSRRRKGRVKFHSLDDDGANQQSTRRRDVLADHRDNDPQQVAERSDTRQRVLQALEELDEEFRVAVVLRDVEGMNYEQVAAVLDIPVGTVKSRLHRARGMLHAKLRDLVG